MKTLPLLLAFIAASAGLYAQSTVKGVVQDATGKRVPFATVALLHAPDSSLVKGVPTDESGRFTFANVQKGRYQISVTGVGYQPMHSAVFEVAEAVREVPVMQLNHTTRTLDEVQVKSQKPLFEQQMDRLVINVQSSIMAAGSSALDILERSPGITINRQNNALSMGGKTGVMVMINGKLNRLPMETILQQLGGMNGGNIETIELITAPPAQYDAEGNAGAINIVLKKNTEEGVNSTLTLSGSYGRFNSQRGSLDMNWRRGRANLYGNGYISEGMGFNKYLEHDRSFAVNGVSYVSANQQRIHHNPQRNAAIQLGLDYQWSPRTTVGLIGNGGYTVWGMESDSKTIGYAGGVLTDSILSTVDSKVITRYMYGNANLTHRFSPKHELTFDADYANYVLTNPGRTHLHFIQSQLATLPYNRIEVDKTTPFHIRVGKVDYTRNLPKGQKIQVGLKTSDTQFSNNLVVANRSRDGLTTSSVFNAQDQITEQIHAAYASVQLSPAPKWVLQAGLRYEYNRYQIQASDEANNYGRKNGQWFPTLYATYDLDSTRRLQFAYNRRVNRPSYSQLAAYYIFLDPYQVVTGNPTLLPAYTDALSLSYSWKSVVFTLRYSWETNAILWRNIVDVEKRVQLNQQHNFDAYELASLAVTLPLQPARWWAIQLSASSEYRSISDRIGREFPIHRAKAHLQGNLTQTFTLPGQWKLETTGNFMTAFLDGEQARSARGALDLALQKSVGRNGAKLSIALIDAFNSADWRDWDFQQKEYAVRTYGIYQFSQRHARLSYSQPLGNRKLKAAGSRATASEEERRRAGN